MSTFHRCRERERRSEAADATGAPIRWLTGEMSLSKAIASRKMRPRAWRIRGIAEDAIQTLRKINARVINVAVS